MKTGIFAVILIWLCCTLLQLKGFAQTTTPPLPEQDCFYAIPICQTSYTNMLAYSGSGNLANEINPAYSCLASGEKNDVWYTFTTHSPGYISFTITPYNTHDDYDWAVFNLTSAGCQQIFNDSALEVSCNYDANVGCNGVTGANGNWGSCGQTESVIAVNAGETFVINVSNYSASQSGYTIDFAASTAQIFDNEVPQGYADTISCTSTKVSLHFNERLDCSTLSADGSDFILTDSAGHAITVNGVTAAGCSSAANLSGDIQLTLTHMPADQPVHYLLAQTGTDGNTLSDVCGNFIYDGDTIAAVIVKNDLQLSPPLTNMLICAGDILPAVMAPLQNAAAYQWFINDTLLSTQPYVVVSDTGSYQLRVLQGNFCSATDSFTVQHKPSLSLSLGDDIFVCHQKDIPLIEAISSPADEYHWFQNGVATGSDQNTFQAIEEGAVLLNISKEGFCHASDSINIAIASLPGINLGEDLYLCDSIATKISVSVPTNGNLLWYINSILQTGINNELLTDAAGQIQVVFTDTSGCTETDTVQIVRSSCNNIPVTILLPGNKSFTVDDNDVVPQLFIFDAMGKQIYFNANYSDKNISLYFQTGIYFYTLHLGKGRYLSGKFFSK